MNVKEILQGLEGRHNRIVYVLGSDMVEGIVQEDIGVQDELEERWRKEQMSTKGVTGYMGKRKKLGI